MADQSLNQVLADWVRDHTWAQTDDRKGSVLVVPAANDDRTTFVFHSGFGYFQITGTYDKSADALSDVAISLVAPTNPKSVVVATRDSYPLSTNDRPVIEFDLGHGYVKGNVSFAYSPVGHIFVNYVADLPYAGHLEDLLDIAPTEPTEAGGLTPGHVETITPLETYRAEKAVVRKEEQDLFVRYLKDFSNGPESLAIVTYYEGISRTYDFTVSFLGFFELVLSVDTTTFWASGTLYAVLPWPFGRRELAGVSGSLTTGIEVSFNLGIANGHIKFWVEKLSDGHHALFAEGSGWVVIHGDWKFGPTQILKFPF